jgi:glycosyltransferase involved in cell wall biosynthesis
MTSISCIICAFNEESTIENVIKNTSDSNLFNQIIVVNDGSTDATASIINKLKSNFTIIDIHLPENKGKGYAMAIGIEKASSEIIVFCDADLSDLDGNHFLQLIKPIAENRADMILGQPTETLINFNFNPFKSLSGQRSLLRKDILPILEDMKISKFGVETLINLYYQSQGKRIGYVKLLGLKHPSKFVKTNQKQAMKEFLFEGYQISHTTFNNFHLISKIIKNKFNAI